MNQHLSAKHVGRNVQSYNCVKVLVLDGGRCPVSQLYKCVLLTYSMVQSPSWAADWFAASQEIPRISRNPKVHYRTHKRTPPVHKCVLMTIKI